MSYGNYNLLKGTQGTKSNVLASNSEWWRGITPLTVYENTVEVLWGETLYVTLDIMVDKNCVLRFDTNNTGSGTVGNDNDSNRSDDINLVAAKAGEWVTHRWSWTNANESKNAKHVALTDSSTIGLEPGTHNEGYTTISVRNVMVTKNGFMAWAPAGGETLAGVGALMSANLLDGIKPEITQYGSMADGVITSSTPKDRWKNVAAWPITTGKFAENQTMHLGISAKWHSAAATSGTAWAAVKYEDAAGNSNNVDVQINGITMEWKRFSLSAVVPSGMRVVDFHISAQNLDAAYDATNPVLSYGSPLVLAIASSTLAWSAGILATVRYYQLAAPTAATPTVPTSSSSLGSWTETEPTADITKVLWTCERTVYADGTESWSKASKSTSYEAAKDAKSTATDAQSKAEALATVIHDGDDGVSVGKSADGGTTYPQGRTRQSGSAFEVLDAKGDAISSLSGDEVSLARGTTFLRTMVGQDATGTPAPQWSLLTSLLSCPIYIGKRDEAVGYEGDVTPEQLAAYIAFSAVGTNAGRISMHAAGGVALDGRYLLTEPTELFYNESQAINTSIPLSDSAGNYKRLKIFYKSDDSDYCSVEVYNPNGKTVALQIARPAYAYAQGAAPVMYVKSKIVKISGATIDTVRVSTYGGGENYLRMQKNLSGNYDASDKVGIIRVEGYKW